MQRTGIYERNADRIYKAEAAPRIFLSLFLYLSSKRSGISRFNGRKGVEEAVEEASHEKARRSHLHGGTREVAGLN